MHRFALAWLATLFVLAPASWSKDPAYQRFRKMALGSLLHREDPELSQAAQLLDSKGALEELFFLSQNLDLDRPSTDQAPLGWWALKRKKAKFHKVAKAWLKKVRKDDRKLQGFEVKELSWQPGQRMGRLELEVELYESDFLASYKAVYGYRLTLVVDSDTWDVVQYRWR